MSRPRAWHSGRQFVLVAGLLLSAAASVALAGGPRIVDETSGQPVVWNTVGPVDYQVDLGPLGSLSNSQAVALVQEAFGTLEDVDTAAISFRQQATLPEDVNQLNWALYFGVPGDGRSPIVFDTDGRILDQVLGLTARNDIEGAARLEDVSGTELREASVILNGACFDGIDDLRSPCELTFDELRALVLHETGHFANLDHSDLNRTFSDDSRASNNAVLPSMYPVETEDDSTFVSLALDDRLALSRLYPAPGFPGSGGTIGGMVLASNGLDPVNGANVVVRNLADPYALAASVVSGDVDGDGAYRFEGLPPGNYVVEVGPVGSAFTGSSSVGQANQATPTYLPGPREFLDSGESASGLVDDPDARKIFRLHAGESFTGEDIVLNDLSTLADDQAGGNNDSFATATVLSGPGTLGDRIGPGDVDFFRITVPQGWTLRVDVDAADPDLGSSLEAVIGLFDALAVEVTASAIPIPDPASGEVGIDPALDYAPAVGDDVIVAIASVGDSDYDGTGGTTQGPYYVRLLLRAPVFGTGLRVTASGGFSGGPTVLLSGAIPTALGSRASAPGIVVEPVGPPALPEDPDGDGVSSPLDPCPGSTDSDGDGVCDGLDNCPTTPNADQNDGDDDDLGDPCDAPSVVDVSPPDGTFDAPLYTTVYLRFSEPIDLASFGPEASSAVRLEGPGAVAVPVKRLISLDGMEVTLDPFGALASDTTYTVVVDPGVADFDQPTPRSVSFAGSTLETASTVPPHIDVGNLGNNVEGSFAQGTGVGDRFGAAIAAKGDANGDGVSDLLVGAPKADATAGPPEVGAVALYFGQRGLVSGNFGSSIRFEGVESGDGVGSSVAFVGDVDGDGIGDLLIGAPGAGPGASATGVTYLVFGQDDLADVCSPIALDAIDDPSCEVAGPACAAAGPCGIAITGEADGDLVGGAVSPGGDVNIDGQVDLLIGAPGRTPNDVGDSRPGAGVVYLLYGSPALSMRGQVNLIDAGTASLPGVVFVGENGGDGAGSSLSAWPDRAADGVDDVLIGSPYADILDAANNVLADAGMVYAINVDEETPLSSPFDLRDVGRNVPGIKGVAFLGSNQNSRAGFRVSGRHDVTGDGEMDILFGSPRMDFPGRTAVGAGILVPSSLTKAGDDPIKLKTSATVDVTQEVTLEGGGWGEFERVGSDGSAPASVQLRQQGNPTVVAEFEAVLYSGEATGDEAGSSIEGVGDLDGDGIEDVSLGAPGVDIVHPVRGLLEDAGRVYVLLSQPLRPEGDVPLAEVGASVPGVVVDGQTALERLGEALAGSGDVDRTGSSEIVAGAPGDSATPPNEGRVYLSVPIVARAARDLLLVSKTTLEWEPVPGAVSYSVYRGAVATLAAAGRVMTSDATCLAPGGVGVGDVDLDGLPDFADPTEPAAGEVFWYLVGGVNKIGEGQVGTDSSGKLHVNNEPCP